MENMNFYQIQIGRITRAGNMDALHSFVCRTSNSNNSNVYSHFTKKYSGLNVICTPIKEVITEEIVKETNDYDFGVSEQEKLLRNKIKELESKTEETSIVYDRIDSFLFPKDAKVLIEEMCELTSQRLEKRKEAESIIKNHIFKKYTPFAKEITLPDNLKDSNNYLHYKVYLKGKLKVDFEKPE